MPKISTHGFERRITDEAPSLSRGQVKAAAKKLAWIAEHHRETFDFFESLRILGIVSDPTPREAIRNIEREAAA